MSLNNSNPANLGVKHAISLQRDRNADILGDLEESERGRGDQDASGDNETEARTGRTNGPRYIGDTGTRNRTAAINAANRRASDSAFTRGTDHGLNVGDKVIPEAGEILDEVRKDGIGEALAESGLNLGAPGSNTFPPFGFNLGQLGRSNFGSSGGLGKSNSNNSSDNSTGSGGTKTQTLAEKLAKYYTEEGAEKAKKYFKNKLGKDTEGLDTLIDSLKGKSESERVELIQKFIDENNIDPEQAKAAFASLTQKPNPLDQLEINDN